MPRVTIFPAYSAAPDTSPHRIIFDAPEACTALTIKRAAGHDTTSWLYVRLPRHPFLERCDCYSCEHAKEGWWKRPAWVRQSEHRTTWHRWIRYNVGARNVRLSIKGGEHFVVVATVDMPQFAAELADRGRHGSLMALAWFIK